MIFFTVFDATMEAILSCFLFSSNQPPQNNGRRIHPQELKDVCTFFEHESTVVLDFFNMPSM